MYNDQRCYIYNKAFARWFDNNDAYPRSGGIMSDYKKTCDKPDCPTDNTMFDLIRQWADERGLYEHGDPKTQYIKLMEEAGEVGRAILKEDIEGVIDGIGDMAVVMTNLAELCGVSIEECVETAYNEIKDRTGKMNNGTFKKD